MATLSVYEGTTEFIFDPETGFYRDANGTFLLFLDTPQTVVVSWYAAASDEPEADCHCGHPDCGAC